jgi:hypothetical protein
MRGRYFRKRTNKKHADFVYFARFLAKYQLEPRNSYPRRPRRARQGVRASHSDGRGRYQANSDMTPSRMLNAMVEGEISDQ